MLGLARPSRGYIVSLLPDSDYAIGTQLAYGWSEEPLVDGGLAEHFLHWVEQAYGSQAFQAWSWSDAVRQGNAVAAAFAEATGQPVAVAQERWIDESELDVVFDGFCHGLEAPPLPPEGLLVQASPCCDAPGVEQAEPPFLNSGQRCFTLPADTEVDVELLAGEGELVLRADGCGLTRHSPLVLQPGEATTVTLSACRWRVVVFGPERCEAGDEVRYAITPS
jgi:hypothetical protein